MVSLLKNTIRDDPGLHHRLANSQMRGKFTGAPLATYDSNRSLVGDRVLLVGDAAGLINPLNGEGIQYALESARWAAGTLLNCCDSGECHAGALSSYEQKVQREMGLDMAVASFFIDAIRNKTLGPLWLELMLQFSIRANADEEYADAVAGILSGLVPARHALDLQMFSGSFRQFVDSSRGLQLMAVEDPAAFAKVLAKWFVVGSRAASVAISDPIAYASWVTGLTRSATRLSLRAIQDMLNGGPTTGS